MKKLLITLLSITSILTACNNNVGAVPQSSSAPVDPNFLVLPQDGIYSSGPAGQGMSDNFGIIIESHVITTMFWRNLGFYKIKFSPNKDICMWGDMNLPPEVFMTAEHCSTTESSITFRLEPWHSYVTLKFEHKFHPMNVK